MRRANEVDDDDGPTGRGTTHPSLFHALPAKYIPLFTRDIRSLPPLPLHAHTHSEQRSSSRMAALPSTPRTTATPAAAGAGAASPSAASAALLIQGPAPAPNTFREVRVLSVYDRK